MDPFGLFMFLAVLNLEMKQTIVPFVSQNSEQIEANKRMTKDGFARFASYTDLASASVELVFIYRWWRTQCG
jgi:hypothetical protein